MIFYLNSLDWGCGGNEKPFSDDVEKRIRSIIKRSAAANGSVSRKFSSHSLRSGGATSMYVRGSASNASVVSVGGHRARLDGAFTMKTKCSVLLEVIW